ncbi:recombinase family protein [Ruegeria sp. 1NDH52C]|uniref:Recombinase family protein n=1 Tax=Ruegeria alba TaxID=2916756 RepID=A0ABS9P2H7_9RHOB|nr:recombinase family protein [Ruegeria alba]MCG6560697.1 recombinase family protein [Ruegeria alba]
MIRKRCAIYTRKSTEEGLEQDFNSLDAQREACAAYILSQKHEGWSQLSEAYDDGGYSGGSMDRPGLQQLLNHVRNGRIDIIVVYKVDRLTRSLSDFARMVDTFDRAGVSFVSVTQAFNTTSSMGRLTLNVLLSFAQFEREVTAERIRDKVAASKQKGMWMGGSVPVGYEAVDKALVVNEAEATLVRTIFAEYLATGCVRKLSARLRELNILSRRWVDRHGQSKGGKVFSQGALYYMLRNPIYVGKTRHKKEIHEGLHTAIIDDATWHSVQAQLAKHGGRETNSKRHNTDRALIGLLFDSSDRKMGATYASKSVFRDGVQTTKRYWYYVSTKAQPDDDVPVERLPAQEIERIVLSALTEKLSDHVWIADHVEMHIQDTALVADVLRAATALSQSDHLGEEANAIQNLYSLITRVAVRADRLEISMNLAAMLGPDNNPESIPANFEFPFKRRQNGRAKPVVIVPRSSANPDPDLIALVADARRWAKELMDGSVCSIKRITEREGLRSGAVSRILPLAWLAPDISTAILVGRQPAHLTAKTLRDLPELPLDWEKQRELLGFL